MLLLPCTFEEKPDDDRRKSSRSEGEKENEETVELDVSDYENSFKAVIDGDPINKSIFKLREHCDQLLAAEVNVDEAIEDDGEGNYSDWYITERLHRLQALTISSVCDVIALVTDEYEKSYTAMELSTSL